MSSMNENIITIGQIGRVVTGKTPPTSNQEYFEGDYPFITPTDIGTFYEKCLNTTERTISNEGVKILKSCIIPANSVCFVSIGSTIGKMCYTNKQSFTNQQINSIVVNDNFDSEYIFYYLRYIRSYFMSIGSGTGSGKGIVNKSTFCNTKVKIEMNKDVQKSISNVLSTYDSLIENNNKRIKILEQMAEEIYKEWFVRFRYPGYENEVHKDGIPCKWNVSHIKNLGKVKTGKTPLTTINENYGDYCMFVKTPDMHDNIFVIETSENLSELGSNSQKNCLLYPNSIMVSCIGTGGVVSINKELAHTNQQINSIILEDLRELYWAFFTVKSLKETILLYGNTGTTMTNLSKGKFEKIKFINPTKNIKHEFQNLVEPIMSEIYYLMKNNMNLIKQRDLLLPRLMSGKLEVK